jgi:hypothetical protein
VFINMPEANPLALALAEAQGLDHFATTARMYTRGLPPAPLARLYAHDIF